MRAISSPGIQSLGGSNLSSIFSFLFLRNILQPFLVPTLANIPFSLKCTLVALQNTKVTNFPTLFWRILTP